MAITVVIYSVVVPCPECGGDIPYEVEAQPPLLPGGRVRWLASDQERACSCQMSYPTAGVTDEQAYEIAWRALDLQAIAIAKQESR